MKKKKKQNSIQEVIRVTDWLALTSLMIGLGLSILYGVGWYSWGSLIFAILLLIFVLILKYGGTKDYCKK